MTQLDRSLEAFAEDQFLAGESKYTTTCALQNCNIEYPQWPTSARTNYSLTKSAKKGWNNIEPGMSRDPCPFEVAMWISYDMVMRGFVSCAAAVVMAFDTYLRPGKVCELVFSNVVPPSKGVSKRYHQWTLLLHPQELREPSKVGQYNDSLTVGSSDRNWIGQVLGRIYATHTGGPKTPLFGITLGEFEKQFSLSVKNLQIESLKLTPHCLRHGGASHDYLAGLRTLQDIQQRGCWASYDSVKRYAKHGRLTKQLNLLSPKQQNAAKQAALELPRILLQHLK